MTRNELLLKRKFHRVVREATSLLEKESIDPIEFTDLVQELNAENGPPFPGDPPNNFKIILIRCGEKGKWDYRNPHVLFTALTNFYETQDAGEKLEIDYLQSVAHHSATMTIGKWLQTTEKWRKFNEKVVKHHVRKHSNLAAKLEGIKINETTVAYLETLWKKVKLVFELPELDYILYSIEIGSIIVTWLIPADPWIEEKIKKFIPLREHFLKRFNIVCIMINGKKIYSQVCCSYL